MNDRLQFPAPPVSSLRSDSGRDGHLSSGDRSNSQELALPPSAVTTTPRWLGKHIMDRKRVLGIGLFGILVLGGSILGIRGMGKEKPAVAGKPRRPMVTAEGIVQGAGRELPLVPEMAGTLARVYVRLNQEVAAGTLLFELSNDPQRAEVALRKGELLVAQEQLKHAQADLGRTRKAGNAVDQQHQDADHFRVQIAFAQVKVAEATLERAEADLAKTRVRAPVAGRVLQVLKEPGVLVGPVPGQVGRVEPVLVMADVTRRRVRAYVEEFDVGRPRVGQQVLVTADGFPGLEFTGTVIEVAGRMGKEAPSSDAPGEYKDIYFRETLIDLIGGQELPLNLRVRVRIDGDRPASATAAWRRNTSRRSSSSPI